MEKHLLSKSTFIRGAQCLKSLYLHTKRPFLRDKLSAQQLAKFKRGTKIGVLARELFPGGLNLRPGHYTQYAKKISETREIIEQGNHKVLYEAGFQYDQLLVFIDILTKQDNGWVAHEVKSSLKISETFLLDAAFQYYVITNSGLKLDDFNLIYVNPKAFELEQKSLSDLFIQQSVINEVLDRQDKVKELVEKEKEVLQLTKSPAIEPGDQCTDPYPCDFIGHCWKKIPKEHWPEIKHQDEDFYEIFNEYFEQYGI